MTQSHDDLQVGLLAGLVSQDLTPDETSSRFAFSNARLREEFFTAEFRPIFAIVTRYYALVGAAPSKAEFSELLASTNSIPLDSKLKYLELFERIAAEEVGLARFRFCAIRLVERWRDTTYSNALSDATKIHYGNEVIDGTALSGYEDSVGYLRKQLDTIDHLAAESRNAGDMNAEIADILLQYEQSKGAHSTGVLTGFEDLDAVTHGIQPGELWLCAGFTGEGKSKIAYNLAYSACYEQGKDVLFCTAEAGRLQVRRNIVIRHSHHPKFERPGGLWYEKVKWGGLDDEDEELFRYIVQDLNSPEYGRLYISQVPYRATIGFIEDELRTQSKIKPVDLLVVDYLGLLGPSIKRGQRREELDDVLVAAKRLATDANGNAGVPLFSPWQISRQAWQEAQKSGKYTKAALADTSQAERSSDLILAVMRKEDAQSKLLCQILKYRDGAENVDFELVTDYATSYVGTNTTARDLLA